MDIILKPILNFIQSLDGMSNSILAGGAVRDSILNLEPKDYDFFVPAKDRKKFLQAVNTIQKEFMTSDILSKTKDYGNFSVGISPLSNDRNLLEVLHFEYKDRQVDIIGVFSDDDEDFADSVISHFDYGINMVYDTGRYIEDSNNKFRRDIDNGWMTLYNLQSMRNLPRAMERYNSLNKRLIDSRGYGLEFDSTIIGFLEDKTRPAKSIGKSKYYLQESTFFPPPLPLPPMPPQTAPAFTTTNTTLDVANPLVIEAGTNDVILNEHPFNADFDVPDTIHVDT